MRYTTGPGGTRPAQLADNGEWWDYPSPNHWLKEWLENQGQYVRLECGHTEDLKDRGALIIGNRVLCDECGWTSVRRSIRFLEYIGLKRTPTPAEPPF